MEGYRIHDHLNLNDPFSSVIRWSPASFRLDMELSPQSELKYVLDNHIDLVVFQKVCGANSKIFAQLCRDNGVASIYILCDYLEDIEMASLCSATIVTSTNLIEMIRTSYPDADVSYCPYATETPLNVIPSYDRPESGTAKIVHLGLRRVPKTYGFLNRVNRTSLVTIGPYCEYDRRKGSVYGQLKADFLWYLHRMRNLSGSTGHIMETKPSTYLPTTTRWQIETVYDELASCQIGVIPLLHQELNSTIGKMKSNSRLLAMWSVGLPTIASPLRSYVEVVNDGVDGFIARSQSDWLRLINLLKDNPELRMEVGRNARKRAYEEFGFERQLRDYLAVFKKACEK
jgi:glycosyltransferase involved in cell wall biosynthesis